MSLKRDQPSTEMSLRPWAEGDLSLLERLVGDPVMMEHLGGPESPEKIRQRHERYCRESDQGPMFVILVGAEQTAAGSIGYWEREWNGQTVWETGWSILPEFQGRGLASEAARLIIEHARADGRHRYLHAFPALDNPTSNAVCRKAGFTLQGAVDFEYPPGHLLRCNDWRLDLWTEEHHP